MIKRLAMVMGLCAGLLMAAERPNVLFIAIDDLRPELGFYGDTQVKSPQLDRLAAEATVFTRAYCQVPVCGASRASLMTSILPTPKRFVTYMTRADEDVPGAATLPETFRKAGYTTLSNGKIFHEKDDSGDRGWSEPAWRPKGQHMVGLAPETMKELSKRGRGRMYEMPDVEDGAYHDGMVAEKTIADLRRLKAGEKPFFLACGFIRPHMPFYAPKRYWDLYQRDGIEIAENRYRPKNAPAALRGSGEYHSYTFGGYDDHSEDFHRMMRHGYLACVSYVDKLVGDVLGELERLGLAENTVVVVWGDHGWHLGEHDFWGKHNTMHLATRVPLMIKVPGKPGGRSASLVETIDVYPTLCGLAGIEVPATVQGKSFVSLLGAPNQPFRDHAYSRYGSGDAVITEHFNFTSYRGGKGEMLYDHRNDPDENVNVAGDPAYREVMEKMRGMLRARQAEAARALK